MEQTYTLGVPLNRDAPANATRRNSVVSGDFYAAIQMNGAFAVLVKAEGSRGNGRSAGRSSANMAATWRWSCRECDYQPNALPTDRVLGLFERFKAQPLQWGLLRMADARLDLAFQPPVNRR